MTDRELAFINAETASRAITNAELEIKHLEHLLIDKKNKIYEIRIKADHACMKLQLVC